MTTPPSGQPLPTPEPGIIEIRMNPPDQWYEVYISNRLVFRHNNPRDIANNIPRLIDHYAYDRTKIPSHFTVWSAELACLPTEEQWAEMDRRGVRALSDTSTPPPTG